MNASAKWEKIKKRFWNKNLNIFFSLNIKWNSNSSFYTNFYKAIFEAILQTKDFLFSANKWASIIPPAVRRVLLMRHSWGCDYPGLDKQNSPSMKGKSLLLTLTLQNLTVILSHTAISSPTKRLSTLSPRLPPTQAR